jgi:transcriptional regulator with XRE-family HTH domain
MENISDKVEIGKRISQKRQEKNLTQKELAGIIGISREAIGQIENGRTYPSIPTIMKLVKILPLNYEYLFEGKEIEHSQEGYVPQNVPFSVPQTQKTPLNTGIHKGTPDTMAENEVETVDIKTEAGNLRLLVIRTDSENQEQIVFVPQKAVAGYAKYHTDPLYIKDLPAFSLPFLRDGTYRAIEIDGDSMEPKIQEGDIAIGRFIQDPRRVDIGSICLIITREDGILCKRVEKGYETLYLHSENSRYEKYPLHPDQISELYLVVGFLRLWKRYTQ